VVLAHARIWTVGLTTPQGQVPTGKSGPAVQAYRLVTARYRPVLGAHFAGLSVRLWVLRPDPANQTSSAVGGKLRDPRDALGEIVVR
jgi:hypothetical protein